MKNKLLLATILVLVIAGPLIVAKYMNTKQPAETLSDGDIGDYSLQADSGAEFHITGKTETDSFYTVDAGVYDDLVRYDTIYRSEVPTKKKKSIPDAFGADSNFVFDTVYNNRWLLEPSGMQITAFDTTEKYMAMGWAVVDTLGAEYFEMMDNGKIAYRDSLGKWTITDTMKAIEGIYLELRKCWLEKYNIKDKKPRQ